MLTGTKPRGAAVRGGRTGGGHGGRTALIVLALASALVVAVMALAPQHQPGSTGTPRPTPSPSSSGRYIVITVFLAEGKSINLDDRLVELGVTGVKRFPFSQVVRTTTATTYKGVDGWSWTSDPTPLDQYETYITVGVNALKNRTRVGVWVEVSDRKDPIEGLFQTKDTAVIVDLR